MRAYNVYFETVKSNGDLAMTFCWTILIDKIRGKNVYTVRASEDIYHAIDDKRTKPSYVSADSETAAIKGYLVKQFGDGLSRRQLNPELIKMR